MDKEEDFFKVTNLKALYSDLVKFYFRNFFNKSQFTLVLPGQSKVIYDSNLVNYLLKIVNTDDAPEVRCHVDTCVCERLRGVLQPGHELFRVQVRE